MFTAHQLTRFTEELIEDYKSAKIHSPVHFCGGNEAQLIEIFRQVPQTAYVFSTWRSHYHALLHGVPKELVKQQILNGHSINLNFPSYQFFSSGIVGGILPIACGVAATGREVWCFVGDMTASIGAFHDAWQYAEGHNLPIHFVVEDNGVATNTPTRKTWCNQDPYELRDTPRCSVTRYYYQRTYPHVGLTTFVQF